jgi:EmrB/QacA subfamily drug resistance transporter
VAAFMTLLDVSIVNVALPSIREGLQASQTQLQWIVSGYALAFGLVLVPAGRLGDLRGRRTVFVTSLALFTVASAGCGLAGSASWLIVARLVQGVAGGMLNPQVSGFVQELFRGPERGRAFGLQGSAIGLSTAVGPLAGGGLIGLFGVEHGWRSVFFVNVPIGLVAIVLAIRLLPASTGSGRQESLDPVGIVLLGAGTGLLLLPLVEERTGGAALMWRLLPASALVLIGFVLWERGYARRGHEPMIDLSLFRRASYTVGSAVALAYFAGFTAVFFILALYLQSGLGYTALESGLAVTPFAVGSGLAAFAGGRLVSRLGRPLVAAGLAVVAVALAVTALVISRTPQSSVGWASAAPLLVAGLGSGVVISPNITLALSQVPVADAGTAGGMLQTFQRIGSAIGIAGVGAVFFSHVGGRHTDWTSAVVTSLVLCSAITLLALALALADLVLGRRAHHAKHLETRPTPPPPGPRR